MGIIQVDEKIVRTKKEWKQRENGTKKRMEAKKQDNTTSRFLRSGQESPIDKTLQEDYE